MHFVADPETTPAEASEPPAKPPRPAKPAPAGTDAAAGETTAPVAAKPKEAPPVLPLAERVEKEIIPTLSERMKAQGVTDAQFNFKDDALTVRWDLGKTDKLFTLYFDNGDLEGRKTLLTRQGGVGENVQMFMPPERGFKNVDSTQVVAMLMIHFTTTLTWMKTSA
jgi:Protein of unknown function (DUF2996)